MDKKLSDAELKELQTQNSVIREIIAAKLPISGLKAEFDRGSVVLRGRASDPVARDRASEIADRVPGVNRVDNRIEVVGGAGAAPGGAGAGGADGKGAGAAGSYTIQKGDTLSEIAQRQLGAASRWKEIYEANRGTIADPDKIHPGQVIKIPAK